MDWMSIAVGFVAGAFTGAAGTYLADRFTDYRRGRDASRAANQIWKDIESKFSAIIAEMRGDFTNPAHVGDRSA